MEEQAKSSFKERTVLDEIEQKLAVYTNRKLKLIASDMPDELLTEVVIKTDETLDKYQVEADIAEHLKKNFDRMFSPPWQVAVGQCFSSHVTHDAQTFANFNLGRYNVLIFRGVI